jgi:hypothetical protein
MALLLLKNTIAKLNHEVFIDNFWRIENNGKLINFVIKVCAADIFGVERTYDFESIKANEGFEFYFLKRNRAL